MNLINAACQWCISVMPTWGVALVVLVVGGIVAVVAQKLIHGALKAVGFEKISHRQPVTAFLSRGGVKSTVSELIANGVFYLVVAATLVVALERTGIGSGRSSATAILGFLPSVASGLLVVFLGALIGEIAAGVVRVIAGNIGLAKRDFWGSLTYYAVLVFAAILALKETGIPQVLSPQAQGLLVGAIFVGFALAFGLAGKEAAGNVLARLAKQFAEEKRQHA